MFLVDTNVLSAAAPTKSSAQHALIQWMDGNTDRLFLSAVTIAEVESGIAKADREGARQKAARLTAWLDTVLHLYDSRILPVDTATARLAGRVSDLGRGKGHLPDFADALIAATALRQSYVVLTRNVRHFAVLDVRVHDPFDTLPS